MSGARAQELESFIEPDTYFDWQKAEGVRNRPARYLAFRGTSEIGTEVRSADDSAAERSLEEGGWQIEFENEDPAIHELFEQGLARNGAVCRMKGSVASCTGVNE